MDNNSLNISFTGDLSVTGIFHQKISDNKEIFTDEIKKLLSKKDYVICNLEGATTDACQNIVVKSPGNTINYLSNRNIRVFNLANNHIFDCGINGFSDTVNKIEEYNSFYFGAGKNIHEASNIVYLKNNYVIVALIGICDHSIKNASKSSEGVFSSRTFSLIKDKVIEAKQKADYVVLNFHGGEEYTIYPSPEKRSYLKKLSSINELDIIIGHHSHTFQGAETVNNTLIFYSLGNFVFDIENHRIYDYVNESAILNMEFLKDKFSYCMTPIKIDYSSGSIKIHTDDFINHIDRISRFDRYYNKWIKDAYRVIYNRNITEQQAVGNQLLRNQSALRILFSIKTYKRILAILLDKNQRSVFLGAFYYKLINSLKMNYASKTT
ncbi:CapA family protein [Natronoflexus pectinivorans]|uniref:Capsule synthesis protein PGA_cap n=1 Tax=Natronoflexus pectinivorans TaxID=682526 RepID=A0A4R2GK40_9BACT|nr:CapA family protein [Natronoflexus pectinivorans]TCO09174.1 capsule synthesis protein PGA_cap [Natronoflexus pectinivorans]